MSHCRADEYVRYGITRRSPVPGGDGFVSFVQVLAGEGAARAARRKARELGFAGRAYAVRQYTQEEYESCLQGAGFGIEPAGRVS